MSSMSRGSCGVEGLARIQVLFTQARKCQGLLWDVNLETCDPRATLSVDLKKCNKYEGRFQNQIFVKVKCIFEGQCIK